MYYLAKAIKKIKLSSIKNSTIDGTSKVCGGCGIIDTVIGKYSYIGYDTEVVNADIGSYCSIASNCMIGGGEHPLSFVSTSPVFHAGKNILGINFSQHKYSPYKRVHIGNDVWIAHEVKIKSGISIATGAVVGMGAVVTHDVGAYEIWAGNPARLIKKRFSDDIIEKLLKSRWWEMSKADIEKYAETFDEPGKLLRMMNLV